jgi:hypothetical protein
MQRKGRCSSYQYARRRKGSWGDHDRARHSATVPHLRPLRGLPVLGVR